MSGGGGPASGRASPPFPATGTRENGTMHAAITLPGISRTFLTHMGVRGLEDERYVVERFQAMADGDIRRVAGEEPAAKKGRRKARPRASLNIDPGTHIGEKP